MGLVWVHLNAIHAFFFSLLYLANKCTIYVNNYLFLVVLVLFSMFTHHPQSVLLCMPKLQINKMEIIILVVVIKN